MFRRNTSTFDVIWDKRHRTNSDRVLLRTVSRTMGLKLARSPLTYRALVEGIKQVNQAPMIHSV